MFFFIVIVLEAVPCAPCRYAGWAGSTVKRSREPARDVLERAVSVSSEEKPEVSESEGNGGPAEDGGSEGGGGEATKLRVQSTAARHTAASRSRSAGESEGRNRRKGSARRTSMSRSDMYTPTVKPAA
jgi:hypothetical protein